MTASVCCVVHWHSEKCVGLINNDGKTDNGTLCKIGRQSISKRDGTLSRRRKGNLNLYIWLERSCIFISLKHRLTHTHTHTHTYIQVYLRLRRFELSRSRLYVVCHNFHFMYVRHQNEVVTSLKKALKAHKIMLLYNK